MAEFEQRGRVTMAIEVAQGAATNGRRQRRYQDLHDRLYDAACELFVESDFVSTSVDAIAERADVARKTAFNHYPRKRDFIAEWGIRSRKAVGAVLETEPATRDSFEHGVRRYFEVLAAICEAERPLSVCMLSGWRENGGPFDDNPHPLVDVLRGMIAAAVDRGEIRPVDQARVATLLYSCCFGTLFDWADGTVDQPPFDLQQAYEQLLDVVLRGLATATD